MVKLVKWKEGTRRSRLALSQIYWLFITKDYSRFAGQSPQTCLFSSVLVNMAASTHEMNWFLRSCDLLSSSHVASSRLQSLEKLKDVDWKFTSFSGLRKWYNRKDWLGDKKQKPSFFLNGIARCPEWKFEKEQKWQWRENISLSYFWSHI